MAEELIKSARVSANGRKVLSSVQKASIVLNNHEKNNQAQCQYINRINSQQPIYIKFKNTVIRYKIVVKINFFEKYKGGDYIL